MTSPLAFNSHRDRGFGLVSMIFILLFLSLSVVAVVGTLKPSLAETASLQTQKKMQVLEAAIVAFNANHAGTNPTLLDDLVTTTGAACAADTNASSATYGTLQGWCGPYIDRNVIQNPNDFKTDGWGTLFVLGTTTLKSCGPNKTCGDADDISDSL